VPQPKSSATSHDDRGGRLSLPLVIAVAAGAAIVGYNVGYHDARDEENDGCWDYQTRYEPACSISTVC
jgi:hypothetical protein